MTFLLFPLSYFVHYNLLLIIVNCWSLFNYFSLYITLILMAYLIFPYLIKFLVIIIRVIYFLLGYIVKKFAKKIGIIL